MTLRHRGASGPEPNATGGWRNHGCMAYLWGVAWAGKGVHISDPRPAHRWSRDSSPVLVLVVSPRGSSRGASLGCAFRNVYVTPWPGSGWALPQRESPSPTSPQRKVRSGFRRNPSPVLSSPLHGGMLPTHQICVADMIGFKALVLQSAPRDARGPAGEPMKVAPCRARVAAILPPSEPCVTRGQLLPMMISTRRLLERFSGVLLSTTGLEEPFPSAEMRSAGTPRETR